MPPRIYWQLPGGFLYERTFLPAGLMPAELQTAVRRYFRGGHGWSLGHYPRDATAWGLADPAASFEQRLFGPAEWRPLAELPAEWCLTPEPEPEPALSYAIA